ncbi:LysE family translocator [Olivibacter sitiensis]|uniref:LysE family translocator n=1 Tax=Olivibacter sitiensis TaxID=376470 RepID=UPI000489DA01|nr:LysE family transporter [Olivibacter sitiensis]
MIDTIISGIGLGLLLSFLTGPAFFSLIRNSMERGFYAGAAFAFGIFTCDILYVSIALYGSSFISREKQLLIPVGIIGSLILLVIGIKHLIKTIKINKKRCLSTKEHGGFFFKGLFMCICNPTLLFYWIGLTSGFVSANGSFNINKAVPFFASVLLTQLASDCTKAFYADKLSHKIEEKVLNNINKFAGALIIIIALRLMYQLVFTQHTI